MPSASFNASSTTSVLRCSLSRLASGADSWLSTSVRRRRCARPRRPASPPVSGCARAPCPARSTTACAPRRRRAPRRSGSRAPPPPGRPEVAPEGATVAAARQARARARACGSGSGAGVGVGADPPRGGAAGFVLRVNCFGGLAVCAAAGPQRWRRRESTCPGASRCVRALQQGRLGVAGRRQQQPRAHHLEQQPRRGGPTHLAETGVHHLGVARQRPRRRCARPARASGPARRRARRPRLGRLRRAPPAARSDRGSVRADRWRSGAGRGPRR